MHKYKTKILHVFDESSYVTISFLNFVAEHYGDNQFFLPIKRKDKFEFSKKHINCLNVNLDFKISKPFKFIQSLLILPKLIYQYDAIIWHSLFFNKIIIVYLVLFHKNIVKKSIWMEWGGDLYEVNCRHKIIEKLYWKFVRTLKAIITIFDGDVEAVRNIAKFEGIIYEGCYGPPSSGGFDKLPILNNEKHKKGSEVIIQVGHSTNSSNNHFKILDLLTKYKDQNIKILLPINYGDMNYSKKVAEHARKLFDEDKLIILEDFIPLDEYLKLLSKVNVCIFDTFRQLGLGNLHYFLGHNIPIYLNKDGVMYKYWSKVGVKVGNIDDINSIENADDLIFECDNQNTDYVKHRYDDKYFYELWKGIFTNIEKDFNNAK